MMAMADLATRNSGLSVPVAVSLADIAGRQLSLHHGQNFIQKPASPQQLLETVRRCLDS